MYYKINKGELKVLPLPPTHTHVMKAQRMRGVIAPFFLNFDTRWS